MKKSLKISDKGLTDSALLVNDRMRPLVCPALQVLIVPEILHIALGDYAEIHIGTGAQVIIDSCMLSASSQIYDIGPLNNIGSQIRNGATWTHTSDRLCTSAP